MSTNEIEDRAIHGYISGTSYLSYLSRPNPLSKEVREKGHMPGGPRKSPGEQSGKGGQALHQKAPLETE